MRESRPISLADSNAKTARIAACGSWPGIGGEHTRTMVDGGSMKLAYAVAAMMISCGGAGGSQPAATTRTDPAMKKQVCAQSASDLTAYLTAVFDPAQKPAPPWPSGDDAMDQQITAARDALRKLLADTSSGKAASLAGGVKPGLMDATLTKCPQAQDAVKHIADFPEPDHMTKAAHAIGDGVVACGCNVDIPLVEAGFYLIVRGPD